jgi:hypothetical protein
MSNNSQFPNNPFQISDCAENCFAILAMSMLSRISLWMLHAQWRSQGFDPGGMRIFLGAPYIFSTVDTRGAVFFGMGARGGAAPLPSGSATVHAATEFSLVCDMVLLSHVFKCLRLMNDLLTVHDASGHTSIQHTSRST